MSASQKVVVTTGDAFVAATQDKNVQEIVASGHLTGVPSVRLSPGQGLHGADKNATITFANGADGVQLSSDNRIVGLRLEVAPNKRAVFNDTTVTSLGRIELRNLTTIGLVQILARDKVRGGHVDVDGLDIIAAYTVADNAFTLWNMQLDDSVVLTADLVGLSAGRDGAPVRGSGIFVSGGGDYGGRVDVKRLETVRFYSKGGVAYSKDGIRRGTPDQISGFEIVLKLFLGYLGLLWSFFITIWPLVGLFALATYGLLGEGQGTDLLRSASSDRIWLLDAVFVAFLVISGIACIHLVVGYENPFTRVAAELSHAVDKHFSRRFKAVPWNEGIDLGLWWGARFMLPGLLATQAGATAYMLSPNEHKLWPGALALIAWVIAMLCLYFPNRRPLEKAFVIFTWIAALFILVTAILPAWVASKLGAQPLGLLLMASWMAVAACVTVWSRQQMLRMKESNSQWAHTSVMFSFGAFLVVATYLLIAGLDKLAPTELPASEVRCSIDNVGEGCFPDKPLREPKDAFQQRRQSAMTQSGKSKPTLVLIASAGGGIRAAYWTATLLGRLEDTIEGFDRHILALSGVSGGAFGVAYNMLTATAASTDGTLTCKDVLSDGAERTDKRYNCARAFMAGDFLAPNVASLLTGTVLNIAIPSFLPPFKSRDSALEESWERRWRELDFQGRDAASMKSFGSSFLQVVTSSSASILLNATSAIDGRRILTSDLNLTGVLKPNDRCHVNLADHRDVPFSSAANLSARFPIIEPAGAFPIFLADKCRSTRKSSKDNKKYEIAVDGGYFDNYGAQTLLDLIDHWVDIAGGKEAFTQSARLLVIQITNDPDIFSFLNDDVTEEKNSSSAGNCPPNPYRAEKKLKPIRDDGTGLPIRTIMQVQAQVGLHFARALKLRTAELEGKYFHFGLDTDVSAPLAWTLSSAARCEIDRMIKTPSNNKRIESIAKMISN
jgi:hypothetical protein